MADGGEIAIGVDVAHEVEEPSAEGGSGSIPIGVDIANDVVEQDAPTPPSGGSGEIHIGVDMSYDDIFKVQFVGIYLDDDGKEDVDMARSTIDEQDVGAGRHADEPALPSDSAHEKYWADCWYDKDPLLYPDQSPVKLVDVAITEGRVFYCVWRTGIMVTLDANDGTCNRTTISVMPYKVKKDDGYEVRPDAKYDALDKVTIERPGYRFMGWYLAENVLKGTGAYDADSEIYTKDTPSTFVSDGGENQVGSRLCAAWKRLAPVKLVLNDATGTATNLYYWTGVGYTDAAPYYAAEKVPGFNVYTEEHAPATLDALIDTKCPGITDSQRFVGWGVKKTGEADRMLVSLDAKAESGSPYRLEAAAFDEARSQGWATWDPASAQLADGPEDFRMTNYWHALYEIVHISVAAPFEVTFYADPEKKEAWSTDTLSEKARSGETITTTHKFVNRSGDVKLNDETHERVTYPVYIKRIEVTDMGGSVLLADAKTKAVLALEDRTNAHDVKKLAFGLASPADDVRASGVKDAADTIVLPAASTTSLEGAERNLTFSLDLGQSGFKPAAVAAYAKGLDSQGGNGQYVAKLANIKYTYSVCPWE